MINQFGQGLSTVLLKIAKRNVFTAK